jgi:hypothetical protein
MTSWPLPTTPLTPAAATFRQSWAERWHGYHPRWGYNAPDGVAYDHRHAHPEFRDPLSSEDGVKASAEFHGAVIERLAAGRPVTLMTFDYESEWQGQREYETSSLDGLFNRVLAWSITEPPEEGDVDPDKLTVHVFITQVDVDDSRLDEVWANTSNGSEPLLIVGPDLNWLAQPHEECVAVNSYDPADIETLRAVERDTWDRWGVAEQRFAQLDLTQVAAFFESRREAWKDNGVRVATEPQYRTWLNHNDMAGIVEVLPVDLSLTDWFLIGLESDTAEVTLIVHDSGACTVQLDPDLNDEDAEMIIEYRGRAGSVDFDGVLDVFERVVATLAGRVVGS